ncbi:putative 6,7-dimethyl-8-ribityllumazine synthase [Sarocladium strictum]
MSSLKGPTTEQHDGSGLRVAIVHARWNTSVIEPLVRGAKEKLLACGVKEGNIVVQSCPGAYELPITSQRVISASQIQQTSTGGPSATDLLASSTTDLTALPNTTSSGPFDAVIAIGVLIKGETMHFEYIAEATTHGLMRVQLDTGVPVIFGVLTVLNDEQALARAGEGGSEKAHNHGEDWGLAAVEMGVKRREWAAGKIEG